MQTEIFKRPARIFAFTLAMSLLLTGALFSQHVAYEDKSREAAIAAERFQQLQRQDYELRFNTGSSESVSSMTRRESLQHSALQLRNAESDWQSLSAEQARLGVFSDVCSFSILCSYFSGLLLAACLLLMAVKRLLSRAAAFPGTASGLPEL